MQGLKSLQPRIQAWLGRCGDTADALAVEPLEQQAACGGTARWDTDNKLGLTVPFPEDQSLVVWLDKTLPKVTLSSRHPLMLLGVCIRVLHWEVCTWGLHLNVAPGVCNWGLRWQVFTVGVL